MASGGGITAGARISVGKAEAALTAIDRKVDLATTAALKKVTAQAAASVRSGMRGRPRWDRRGKSQRTGPEVNLNLSPHHVKKNGGPGRLSGSLSRYVKKSRNPRVEARGQTAVVFVGGSRTAVNLYKGLTEGRYPYFAPGIKKAEKKMPAVWSAAWAKATNK